MQCTQCGTSMQEADAFCPSCGAPAPTPQPVGAEPVGAGAPLPPPLPAEPPASYQAPPPLPADYGAAPTAPLRPPPLPAETPAPYYPPAAAGYAAPPAYPGGPAGYAPLAPDPGVKKSSGAALPIIIIASVVVLVLFVGAAIGLVATGSLKRFAGLLPGGSAKSTTAAAPSESAPSAATPGAASPAEPAAGAPADPAVAAPAAPAAPPAAAVAPWTPQMDTPERKALMDAARSQFRTSSQFYVNQLYIQGDTAIGDIAAVKTGKRVLVVWRGQPPKVIYSRKWAGSNAGMLPQQVADISPELVGAIDFGKRWPAEFK